jgi:hypothetical protein
MPEFISKSVMRTQIISLLILFLAINISAQENLSRKESRMAKKQKKEAAAQASYDSLFQVINSKQFVLEANYLDNLKGRRSVVLPTLNFIKVDSATNSVIQIGSNRGLGYNGVGGVTAEGRLTRYEVSRNDKKKTIHVSMSLISNIGLYDILLDVDAENRAVAVVTGLERGRLQYEGNIVPLEESSVYQGHTP